MSRKLTKAEALYCARLIEELYEMIDAWKDEGRPEQGDFVWPLEDFEFTVPDGIFWCTNVVYRRQPGGRLKRYKLEKEISPMAVTGIMGTTLHVSLRGTNLHREWDMNTDFLPVPFTLHGRDFGFTHDGFCDAYESMIEAIRESVTELIAEHEVTRLIVSGHSLGGAVATLVFADLAFGEILPDAVEKLLCTFGAPKVGNDTFRNCLEAGDIEITRFENVGDIVPLAPPGYPSAGDLIGLHQDTGSALGNHAMMSYIAGVTNELGLGLV